ncbi:hypothetical protein [Siminovitchia sp. 179-K 8D1 HS]|uniref:hypothetical protein n=1 Tax=Siminovitchia sp. 179-K 8D1 HS TaxID=3142385 RepID=UPI0039A0E374
MKQKIRNVTTFRINLLLFIIFLIFCVLILRLGYLQVVHGEQFYNEVNKSDLVVVKKTVPRGSIYDRKHRLLVGNKGRKAITFFRESEITPKVMLELAEELTKYISVDITDLKKHDLQEYFIAKYPDKINHRLSEMEQHLKEGELYKAQIKKVTDHDLASLNETEKSVASIYI